MNLFDPAFAPFTVSLMVMLLILLFELAGALFGASASELLDKAIPALPAVSFSTSAMAARARSSRPCRTASSAFRVRSVAAAGSSVSCRVSLRRSTISLPSLSRTRRRACSAIACSG